MREGESKGGERERGEYHRDRLCPEEEADDLSSIDELLRNRCPGMIHETTGEPRSQSILMDKEVVSNPLDRIGSNLKECQESERLVINEEAVGEWR
jgi:hypothetical protein